MTNFVNHLECARYAYGQGIKFSHTTTLKRGRQTVGTALHLNEDAPELAELINVRFISAQHRYAPELKEKVALFLTKAELKRREAIETNKP